MSSRRWWHFREHFKAWRYRRSPEHKAWVALYDSGAICRFCDTPAGGECPVPESIRPEIPCLAAAPEPTQGEQ